MTLLRLLPLFARAVAAVRRPFLAGAAFDRGLVNPINDAALAGPIDEVLGYTKVALHRANAADHAAPAVLEGSSHDLLADAFRGATRADGRRPHSRIPVRHPR